MKVRNQANHHSRRAQDLHAQWTLADQVRAILEHQRGNSAPLQRLLDDITETERRHPDPQESP